MQVGFEGDEADAQSGEIAVEVVFLERILSSRMQASRTQWFRPLLPPEWPPERLPKERAQPDPGEWLVV